MSVFFHHHHILLAVLAIIVTLLIVLFIIDCFLDTSIWSFFAMDELCELLGSFFSWVFEIW